MGNDSVYSLGGAAGRSYGRVTEVTMRRLVYDVATSVDGFVSHADGSVEGFQINGEHVADYLQRLAGYDTVLMGRSTYEWGYRFGLTPGAPAYPHMLHLIFSRTLRFEQSDKVRIVSDDTLGVVERLKHEGGTDLYLCGGGAFAGFLLEHGLIDRLILKQNPVVFGHGIRLFGASMRKVSLQLGASKRYDNGVALLEYDVVY
jgi:dihydrofolate reductase